MFKNVDKKDLDLTESPATLTVPFQVHFGDQNPDNLKNIPKTQSLYENILGILDTTRQKNLENTSKPVPKPIPKNDIPDDKLSVILGKALIYYHSQNGIPIRDNETGEIINTQKINSNIERAAILYNTNSLTNLSPQDLQRLNVNLAIIRNRLRNGR